MASSLLEGQPSKNQAVEWIVLSKAPVAGLVKTRLIPAMGEQAACDVYTQLLARLENTLRNLIAHEGGSIALWIAGDCDHESFKPWVDIADFYSQPDSSLPAVDLGVRMAMAVQSSLSRGRIPILIGVDVPDLTEVYLKNCLTQLKSHDLVISPAEDGGYGLLGMKRFYAELFEDKLWGTNSVFDATCENIDRLNINSGYLPKVWDVDEIADVERFWLLRF